MMTANEIVATLNNLRKVFIGNERETEALRIASEFINMNDFELDDARGLHDNDWGVAEEGDGT